MITLEDLKRVREEALKAMSVRLGPHAVTVTVGMGTCGIAAGARETMSALLDELCRREIWEVTVLQTGCRGMCAEEPLVEVEFKGRPPVLYGQVTPEMARQIVAGTLDRKNNSASTPEAARLRPISLKLAEALETDHDLNNGQGKD